jgi:hypothetical protein
MRVLMALPDPAIGPDRWTQRSLALRNLATLEGECRVCPARPRFAGVDHRELRHTMFEHDERCRCGDERIAAHLRHRGVNLGEERYVIYVVDAEAGHWTQLEGEA